MKKEHKRTYPARGSTLEHLREKAVKGEGRYICFVDRIHFFYRGVFLGSKVKFCHWRTCGHFENYLYRRIMLFVYASVAFMPIEPREI